MTVMEILETLLIGPLKLAFELIYVFANRMVGDPGLSIVVLSLAMNILVLPLYRRADAMQEQSRDIEAKLHDGVAHIKKTFSGDERMMILQTYYRQNHYKPTDALNGSVSLLLEVPFFMAAYQFLSNLEMLQGASFGPIRDLGVPDGLLVIGGVAINVLPILMTLVNVVSSAIYLKGFPLKTKIQLYAMAGFFLVFLYGSPSGLVFYWTLNNVFSLVKTIFYKLRNPKKILGILCGVLGLLTLLFGMFAYSTESIRRKIFVIGVGVILEMPLVMSRLPHRRMQTISEPNRKLFRTEAAFLTILLGLMIPSTLIGESPLEYVESFFYHPLWYLVSSGALAAGTFLVWAQVFYWLASPGGKIWFERILGILCGVMLVNYMFFGTDLGIISPDLQYEVYPSFTALEKVINLLVIGAVGGCLYLGLLFYSRSVTAVLLTASIALGCMAGVNMWKVHSAVSGVRLSDREDSREMQLPLSTSGKNVVVIMLDRAAGQFVPYIMNEKPELKEQFAGFTHYANTVSFGPYTNFGTPPLLGGYEYTPVEMNRRDQESLQSKHNEALKVMPVIFLENQYTVTVCDPVYAGYQWIPDLTVFEEYPEIKAYNTDGMFLDEGQTQLRIQSRKRNFFCFSLMKTMPLAIQVNLYQGGRYNQSPGSGTYNLQEAYSKSEAEGINPDMLDQYNVLLNLPELTEIRQNEENTFLFLCNDLTHIPQLLQEPEYTPSMYVNNTDYDSTHADRFQVNGVKLDVQDSIQMSHYHVNMAAFIQIGNWLDYLRQMGVYDNTRIILVADHGRGLLLQKDLLMGGPENGDKDVGTYYPLLMVKDFDSQEFTTSYEFMTNADVPTLAFRELIRDPVNPFTGNPINNQEKTEHLQYVIVSKKWDVTENNGNTFLPAAWASVSGDIRDPESWAFYDEETILQEHAFPGT